MSASAEIHLMSATERREYLVGIAMAVMLGALLVFTALANRRALESDEAGFRLIAEFGRADGIYTGSPVRLAGIKVGQVDKTALAGGQAVVTMRFDGRVDIPEDTAAVIETDGLFGTKHIELRPGGDETNLAAGGRISYTQDSVILEDLIAMVVARARAAKNGEATDTNP